MRMDGKIGIVTAGGIAHGIVADLTQDDDARRIVWDTVSRFKGLDFVWNHVGHPGPAAVEGILALRLARDQIRVNAHRSADERECSTMLAWRRCPP